MPLYIKNEKQLLFIHIPKCGGTSVENSLVSSGWRQEFFIGDIKKSKLSSIKVSPQHFHSTIIREIFDENEIDYILTLVRHPFDRIKSEYFWRRKRKETFDPPNVWLDKVFNAYIKSNDCFYNHIRPQHHFLTAAHHLRVFKLENDGVQSLLSVLGGAPPTIWNRFRYALSNLSSAKNKSPRPKHIEDDFLQLKPVIDDFYADDYSLLGYER